jgi:UDP-N-acetylglucosamine 2-epimerase (non-hydrolysing)
LLKASRAAHLSRAIYEAICHYEARSASDLAGTPAPPAQYFLVTLHRAENVDVEGRLRELTQALERIQEAHRLPVIVSTHPHTRARMENFGVLHDNPEVRFLQPFGFFDFIKLEQNATCVLSDSGTVQEECAIFMVPNVTLRDVTERPETLECGSNILASADSQAILRCVQLVLQQKESWRVPPEYLVENVSDTVVRILHGYLHATA